MAYFQQHLVQSGGFAHVVYELRARLQHRLAQRAERAAVYKELMMMTDRELADIGIARCSIAQIAREAGRTV